MAAKIPKQVSLFYFTCIGEDIWQCKCTQKRKQIANKGYSNLNSHIAVAHPNWKDEYGSSQKLGFSAVVPSQKVSRKGTNIFRWLEWVMMESLPFSFCERELVCQNSVYNQIRPYVPESDLELMSLVLEDFEEDELKLLTENLTKINSVTLTLRREHGVTLSDIRTLSDGLISKFPDMEHHLSTSAKVVQNKEFENGIVKCLEEAFRVDNV